MGDRGAFPTGTVTFLFTDVEGSTKLWAAGEAAMSASLAVHDSVLRAAIEGSGGYVFTTAGDSFAAAFARASDAVQAATQAQQKLRATDWPGPILKVRMGLHLGEAEERDGDYFGSTVNTAARVEAAGHGGQILLTDAVRTTAAVDAVDLGTYRLRDVADPMALYQIGDTRFAPLRADDPWLSNLVTRPTRLIGRDDDVAAIRARLATDRLVTLTAVGGSGKTRLAQAVGEAELPHRSGGVWFVDLAAVLSGPELPEAIAAAVGLSLRVGDPVDQVIEYLGDQAALVILDNCEHMIDDVADFAERFLEAAGRTSILATSREMLDIDGEQVHVVPALPCRGPDSPGVMLFLDRATAIDADFVVDDSNADAVSVLCARLDGIPLAIELAAIQISVMTPAELLAGLDDRFQLLSGGRRRRRQKTLEATLDWSYELLDPPAQRVFRTLGVFVDGFDLDAAAAVTGLSLVAARTAVQSLVMKSLIVRLERGDVSRFGMLETVKAYAEDRLSDTDELVDVRRGHFAHFRGLAAVHGRVVASEIRLCFALRHDLSNLTAAFEWAAADDGWVGAAELINGCVAAYVTFGRALEGLALLQRTVDHWDPTDTDLVDHLLAQRLHALADVDDFAQAQTDAIRLSESAVPYVRVVGTAFHGWAVSYSGTDRAAKLLARSQRELDEARLVAPGRNTELAATMLDVYRAGNRCVAFDYEGALRDSEDAMAINESLDFHTGVGPMTVAAMCLVLLDRAGEALDLLARQDGALIDAMHVANSEPIELFAQFELGAVDDARPRVRRLAVRGLASRYAYEANDCVVLLAGLALAEGDASTATDLVLLAGTGTGWGVIVADNLAMRLEVTDERHRRILESIRSRDTAHNTTQAATALHAELERRGWVDDGLMA